MNRLQLANVALLLALLSCSGSFLGPSDQGEPHLVVAEAALELRLEGRFFRAEIPFQYTNRTVRTAAFHGCHPPSAPDLEWWDGSEWRTTYLRIESMCLSPPFLVAPGTVITNTLSVFAADSIQTGSNFGPVWRGPRGTADYRLVWGVTDANPPNTRPLRQRVSNTFRLTFVAR